MMDGNTANGPDHTTKEEQEAWERRAEEVGAIGKKGPGRPKGGKNKKTHRGPSKQGKRALTVQLSEPEAAALEAMAENAMRSMAQQLRWVFVRAIKEYPEAKRAYATAALGSGGIDGDEENQA